jgi:hypothetical protein
MKTPGDEKQMRLAFQIPNLARGILIISRLANN